MSPAKKTAPNLVRLKNTKTATGARLGRPPNPSTPVAAMLSLRVSVDVIDGLERYLKQEQTKAPWANLSRNDIVRRLLVDGLDRAGFTPPKPNSDDTKAAL